MGLEQEILKVVEEKLKDGFAQEVLGKEFEKGFEEASKNLLRSYGDVTKLIEQKIKEVMVPFIEKYDFQEYVLKMDVMLQELLKNSALENKKMLENFKELMIPGGEKDMAVTDLFKKWMEYVAHNVETDGLEIDYDNYEPTYEAVDVTFTVEEADNRSWSSMKNAVIYFECEHDEKLNIAIPIHSWNNDMKKWYIDYKTPTDIASLRKLNEFEVFIMKMNMYFNQTIIDKWEGSDSVTPEQRPEATFE